MKLLVSLLLVCAAVVSADDVSCEQGTCHDEGGEDAALLQLRRGSRDIQQAPDGAPCPEPQSPPSQDDYMCEVRNMVHYGPRLTGSPAHKAFVKHIKDTLNTSNFQVSESPMKFQRWATHRYSLVLHADKGDKDIPIAFPWVRSNLTCEKGLTYPLRRPNGTREPHIALVHGTYNVDEGIGGCSMEDVDLEQTPYSLETTVPQLDLDVVKGVVCCLNKPLKRLWGEYENFQTSMVPGVPTVLLAEEQCKELATDLKDDLTATLTLTGTYEEDTTSHVWGILPGRRKDQFIMLGTHTDGQNAVEENGIAAMLTMAKHFGKIYKQEPLEYSLMVLGVTGHMDAYVPYAETWGFCNQHPEIMEKVKVAIDFEHLGVTDQGWNTTKKHHEGSSDNSHLKPYVPYYYYSSDPKLFELFRTTPIAAMGLNDKFQTGSSPPEQGSAVGLRPPYCRLPSDRNITTLSGVVYPWYYLNLERGGLDKISPEYLYTQAASYLQVTSDLLHGKDIPS